jgi:DNA mismatch repair protein MutL
MPQRIRQLPTLVVNQIAAGEVIERPSSVVKELLENAVDAGSSRVEIDVEQGGAELIRVVDNGHGIAPDDLALAFAPHATSKLSGVEDLFRIATLGFRGEALASIGGVAQVQLQSRPPDLPIGAAISCNGGQFSPQTPWNGSPGTRIEVRHLFFNTPVRRKFLRSPATEIGHITEACNRVALARPRIGETMGLHLVLRHNGRTIHDLPAFATLVDRIGLVFGREVKAALYPIQSDAGPVKLIGFIGDPSCDRGTARMQYLFVNGRWIRDRSLGHAVQEAYRGLLMTGRFAICFLFLTLPAEELDVNVHPTKVEVRFRNSQGAHHLIYTTVRKRLHEENLTARLQAPSTFRPSAEFGGGQATLPLPQPRSPDSLMTAPEDQEEEESALHYADSSSSPATSVLPNAAPAPAKVIQLYDAYLVVETEAGMLVIDQHALHERILFERIRQRVRDGALESQRLLVPESIHLSGEQAALLLEQREALAGLGIGVEDFGGGTVLLTSYPALLGRGSPKELLQAVVDHVATKERLPSRDVLFNDLMSLTACHSAVRAGERLTREAMAELVAQRHLADDAHHCPHGRPTALLFSRQDLERQFGRI